MRKATPTIFAALAFLALACPAAALEMLPNGKFDGNVSTWGWCCGPSGTAGFDATRDASGSDLSGSAALAHTGVSESNTYLFMHHCLSGAEVQAGKKFFFGAKARFREGQTSAGRAFLSVEFRPDGACQQASISGFFDDVLAADVPRGTWIALKIGSATNGVTVPAGTNSIRLHVSVEKKGSLPLTVNYDDVFAAPAGTPVCDGMPATIVGTASAELINGTSASDVIVGRGGVDWIDGAGGNDRICGGPAGDVLNGGAGDDRLFGEGGADTLYGATDDDMLNGGGNNDDLNGEAGNDRLKGGTGVDDCNGGAGAGDVAKKCEVVAAVP